MASLGETSTLPTITNTELSTPSAPTLSEDNFNESANNSNSKTSSESTNTNENTDNDKSSHIKDETQNSDSEKKDDNAMFECNICLDTAKDAVVSVCGHLFCWPCLHQWLETRPLRQLCPVCKAAISKDKVVPLYGRGNTKNVDPRTKVPPRPAAQRTEPEPAPGIQGFGFGDGGFHMSFGIGAFPFGFFTSSLNFSEARPSAPMRGSHLYEDDQFISTLFLWVAILFMGWLLLA